VVFFGFNSRSLFRPLATAFSRASAFPNGEGVIEDVDDISPGAHLFSGISLASWFCPLPLRPYSVPDGSGSSVEKLDELWVFF